MNIMLTSAGRRGYLVEYFKQALAGKGKVYVGNSDENAVAFFFGDEAIITPLIYDSNYIDFLLDFCIKKNISVIIPVFDIDLYILSMNRNLFKFNGINVVVSDSATVEICNDKWKMKRFLEEDQILTPKTYLHLNEAIKAIVNHKIEFPLVVKPRWGMGSIGIYEVNSLEELKILYYKTKKQIKNTYLKYESKQSYETSILIQEKIHGQEFGVDIINDLDGIYQNTIVKKKCSMRAGETDIAMVVKAPIIEKLGCLISKKLKHIGNLDMDVILTEDGKTYIIDLNARFGGGYPFTHCAGVNLPKAIIAWVSGETVEKEIFVPQYNVKGYKNIEIIGRNI